MLIEPSGSWTAARVFELVTRRDAVEWRHKVGVTGPIDGSAKATTRLMAVGGLVVKTRMDEVAPTAKAAIEKAIEARASGLSWRVWHPAKLWAVMRSGNEWFRLTVCRELVTLRREQTWSDRLLSWIQMIQVSIDVHRRSGLGLDINPANFGREAEGPTQTLYYLDDEFYERFGERNIADAIVARIPEEPAATPQMWGTFGKMLNEQLHVGGWSWERIQEELRQYPLLEKYEAGRSALLAELPQRKARRHGAGEPKMTCVLADVHANRAALEAVLVDAQKRGADSFLFLGDAVGYGPHPAECIQIIANLESAIHLRGNHDHAIATNQLERGMNRLARECAAWTHASLSSTELAWLAKLPVDYFGEQWMAVHGAPQDPCRFLAYVYELTYEDNLRYLRNRNISLCFYGHTHVQITHVEKTSGTFKLPGARNFRLEGRARYLVNPGSVGQPRDGDSRAGYALWNRQTGEIATLRVAYDLECTIADLRGAALPAELEIRLRDAV